jgi:hypothetical protein
MREIAVALVSLVAVGGCKSGEKSSSAAAPTAAPAPVTAPAPAPAPAPEPAAAPDAPAATAEADGALAVGAPVRKAWVDGGPGEVVWKVEGGGAVTLRAEPGKPEGVLFATYQARQQHVTNFACDAARAGSEASFALTAEGKVIFRAAVAPAGKDPGSATVFLLEWKPAKGTVFVARSWEGKPDAEPPPWAKL